MSEHSGVDQFKPEWLPPLFEVPPVLPTSAWAGHIPFLFLLFDLARPRKFVELGVFFGASFLSACEAANRFDIGTHCAGVDTFVGDEHSGYFDGEMVFGAISAYIAARYRCCELLKTTFDNAIQRFEDCSIDLLHIDGLHTYEAVARDFRRWTPKLSERSIVLFHDIDVRERGFGVWKLWEELKKHYPHFEFHHASGLGVLRTGTNIPHRIEYFLQYANAAASHANLVRLLCEGAGAILPDRVPTTGRAFLAEAVVSALPLARSLADVPCSQVSRNEPCPCGSGKRYKHCHGNLLARSP